MKPPKVSILIPNYNYGHYLSEAIQSALDQTFEDFELIVVDNDSSDNSEEIVKAFIKKDPRVKFHKNDSNIGMFRNYNQSLLLANGEYLKFLNADDKFAPTLLEKFVEVLDKKPEIALATSYRQAFGDKDDVIESPFTKTVKSETAILQALHKGNWIGEPTTVMFRRDNLTLGLFDTSLLMIADMDLWLRQLQVGDLYVVDEVLSYFRVHDNQGTAQLTENHEKMSFIAIQESCYRTNSLLNNRYSYNFHETHQEDVKKIIEKSLHRNRKAHRYLFLTNKNRLKLKHLFHGMNFYYFTKYFFQSLWGKLK